MIIPSVKEQLVYEMGDPRAYLTPIACGFHHCGISNTKAVTVFRVYGIEVDRQLSFSKSR